MGSIVHINTRPRTWTAYDSGRKLRKEYGGEPIWYVCYGTHDDDPVGVTDLDMYMRESVYNKLISGEYHIQLNSNRRAFTVCDKDGNTIEPISPGFCY